MHKLTVSIVTLTAALLASTAHATTWDFQRASGSAIACVPMASLSSVPPYEQTHGKVQHRGTSAENVVLFCHVQIDNDSVELGTSPGSAVAPPQVMTIKYVDPDGTGAAADVLAELKYADPAGNMIELATVDSSAQANATSGIRTMDANISGWDKANGHIFVQLTLKRTDRGLFPAVYGYTLH